ncbi:MAG: hypothetical protein J6Q39_03845 [Bacteroidales bacterium]|nr:hypothetical protein [Bacteroidales bacterium]
MANLDKFLNKAGVSTLWGQIAAEVAKVDTKANKNAEDIVVLQRAVDALEAGTFDDSALKALIQGNTDAIAVLVGNDANMSARAIAAAEVAKIVAEADASFDTLKEIADWIMSDTTGAASMAADIATLEAKLEGVDKTVVESIANAIDAALKVEGADKYALASEVSSLAGQLETIAGQITALEAAKHTHANAETLAGITVEKVAAWDAAEKNAKDYTDSVLPTALTDEEILQAIQSAKESAQA